MEFKVARSKPATIEIHLDTPDGKLLASCSMSGGVSESAFAVFSCNLPILDETQSLCLVFKGKGKQIIQLDSFLIE